MKCELGIYFPMNDNLTLFIDESEPLSVMEGGLWFLCVRTGTSSFSALLPLRHGC